MFYFVNKNIYITAPMEMGVCAFYQLGNASSYLNKKLYG